MGLSGVVTQKGPVWVCIVPFPYFRLLYLTPPVWLEHTAEGSTWTQYATVAAPMKFLTDQALNIFFTQVTREAKRNGTRGAWYGA